MAKETLRVRAKAGPKAPKQAEAGRVCEHRDCATILTIYNRKPTCYLHTTKVVPRLRGYKSDRVETLGVDTTLRCYACALGLGGWGYEVVELQGGGGEWHWWVRSKDVMAGGEGMVRLCEVQ